jgi:hypothetical protein
MGSYTPPIPHDADPGYLKWALEANDKVSSNCGKLRISLLIIIVRLLQIGSVRVIMEAGSDGTPQMCSSSHSAPYETTIIFIDQLGPLPPISVHANNTGPSRMFPDGDNHLSLSGWSSPILRMVTYQQVVCPICHYCGGDVYLAYKDSISAGVDIMSNGVASLLYDAVTSLSDLDNENWPDLSISVSSTQSSLCTFVESVTTIKMYSSAGPLPPIQLIDNSYYDSTSYDYRVNLTLTNNSGTDTLYECSNQGICDRTTGLCLCFNSKDTKGNDVYRAVASNGRGSSGTRGDCGFLVTELNSCYDKNKKLPCSGHGVCYNDTNTCSCYDGWAGVLCQVSSCPLGPAYADQPVSSVEAHQMVECSNMGMCDRRTGHCACKAGFTGDACQYRDCPRDAVTGIPCSGNGRCMNMNELYDMYGLEYGTRWNNRMYPEVISFVLLQFLCS